MAEALRKLMGEERGATAIEYAMVAAGIAMAIVALVNQIGLTLSGIFTAVDAGF